MECRYCGADNPLGELFCQKCGRRLPSLTKQHKEKLNRQLSEEHQRWLRTRRKDLLIAAVWSGIAGFGSLVLAYQIQSFGEVGDLWMVGAGKQAWWFIGLFWGITVYGLRRNSPRR